jgi:hypothetical protein
VEWGRARASRSPDQGTTPPPVRPDRHLPVGGGEARLTVAEPNAQTRPWFGFGDETAPMKLEPEVIADPRGTAVNRSLSGQARDRCRENVRNPEPSSWSSSISRGSGQSAGKTRTLASRARTAEPQSRRCRTAAIATTARSASTPGTSTDGRATARPRVVASWNRSALVTGRGRGSWSSIAAFAAASLGRIALRMTRSSQTTSTRSYDL